MWHSEVGGGRDGLSCRDQVNGPELGCFGGRGTRDTDQMDKGVGGADQLTVGLGIKRVTGDDFAAGRDFALRSVADQGAHVVAALQQQREQTAAQIAGSAGDEDAARVGALGQLFDLQQETDIRNARSHALVRSPGRFRLFRPARSLIQGMGLL